MVLVSLLLVPWLATCRDFPTDPGPADVVEPSAFEPSADAETPQAREDQVIPNRYLVIFQDDVPDVAALARSLAGANGLGVRYTYRHAIKGFAAEFPEAGRDAVLEALQRNPRVKYIEQDKLWYIDTHEMLTGAVVAAPAPPAAPSNLVATPQGATAVDLAWSDNSSDETGFQILRCEGTGCSNFAEVGSTGKNKTSFSDTELQAATEYCYEVTAIGGRGKNKTYSGPAGPVCATTDSGGGDPPADERPSDLSATPGSSTTMDLSWTDNWDNETGFEIERCEGNGCSNFANVGNVGANVTSYADNGLTAGTEYCYRVRGVRIRGKKSNLTEYSNVDCGTTPNSPPPPSTDPPTGLSATSATSTSADLSWTDNSDEDEFEIERCQGNGCSNFAALTTVAADVTAYTDNGLTAGTEYCYRVRGVVSGTPTGFSNTDCATTPNPPAGQFVEDSFEDSPGTLLQSHTGLTGATWTVHPTSAGNAQFSSNGSEVESGAQAVYTASGGPPGADYRVAARMYFHTTSSAAVTYTFVTGRADETARTMYMFGFVYSWVNQWELKKFVNGTETLLASSRERLPSPGDSPLVDLRMEGSTIKGFINGYEVVSATDTDITAPGKAGLRMLTGSAQYAPLADFEATTLDLSPPPLPPSTDPPTDLAATAASSTSASLAWTDNSDEDLFEIERCDGTGCSTFGYLDQVGKNVANYLDSGLISDTEYCYRVRGIVEGAPTGYSNIACLTPATSPPRFVDDSFEDAPGTLLQSHVGEIGATWTPHPTTGGSAEFAPNGSEVQSSVQAIYTASGFPPSPDYRVAARMYFYSSVGGPAVYTFVTGRMDATAKTMYMFGFVYSGVNRWELKKFVNGSEYLLAYTTQSLPSPGDTPLVDLQMEGSTIRGVVDGIEIVSATDTDITAAGWAGLRMRSGNLAFAAMTDFEATTLDLAPPPPTPSTDPPTNLAATVLSSTLIRLAWTDNSDEETFEIERCEGTGCTGFAYLGQAGEDVRSYTDSGLTAGTEYCYQVRGIVGGVPTGYSNVACATPDELPPGECPDTGNHDSLGQLWGIAKTQANLNPTWLGTQTGGGCAIQAWFFGIDSGVDSSHPDLNVIEAVDFLQDGSGPEDGHGHGTHTAGTAAAVDGNGGVVGMAPGAPVFGFKTCGADGSCSLSAIVAAIDEVSARKAANPNQPMVANMSLGGDPSVAMEDAVRNSVNGGVVYAMGAGNGLIGACIFPVNAANFSPALVGDDDINASGGSNGNTKPINGAITVTSSTENDTDANCNYGAPVTVAAPGTNIYSTIHNGGYGLKSGTSMATPHVAGAALLYLQNHPDATPEQVEAAIVGYLDPWTTDEQPNANGRLNAGNL
jgi:hypothetical protein